MSEHDLSACSRSSFQICQIMSSVFAGGSWHAIPPDLSHLEIEAVMCHFRCEGPVCHFCGSDAREEARDIVTIVDHDTELRLRCPCCYNSDWPMPACLACPCAANDLRLWRDATAQLGLQHHQYDQPEQGHRSEHIESQQFAWRDPRQPTSFPLRIASSSNALPEAKRDDKPSKASSCDDYERASIEEDRTNSRGTDTFEQGDLDSKYVFAVFKQALAHSGQAVADICSSNTLPVGPESVTNKMIGDAISATATNIGESDQRGMEAVARKKAERTLLPKQPGEVSKSEEEGQHSVRAFDAPSQHMMNCNSADSKIISSPNRMMANVRVASDELALQTATTALQDEMCCDYGIHKGGARSRNDHIAW